MIVKMKRLTIIVAESHRRKILERLRKLGAVHIKHLTKPSGESIRNLEEIISNVQNAISVLEQYEVHHKTERVEWDLTEIEANAKEITTAIDEREDVTMEMQHV